MPLFIDNESQARAPGVYGIEVAPPTIINEISLGYIGLVGQFAWGPVQSVYTPADALDLLNTFEPAGSPRSSTGYRAIVGRRGLTVKIVRVLGSGAAQATLSEAGTGGSLVFTAKYPGTLGNAISATIAAAASGDTTKRDLSVTLSDPVTGTTTEVYRDVAMGVAPDTSRSLLLASIAFTGTMTAWPANVTANLASGSNGAALGTSDYTGTAGAADKGVALFETQDDVSVLVHDDCGDTNRAAINAAFAAQATTLRDRDAVVDTEPDVADWTTVKGERVNALISDRVVFVGAWVQVNDDAGVARTSPFSTMIATALVNLRPQQSHAWRDPSATKYYDAVVGIVSSFSTKSAEIQGEATEQGICLPIKTASGKYAALHDRPTAPAGFLVTRRVKDYLAKAIEPALDPFVNGPNVDSDNTSIKTAVDNFLDVQRGQGTLVAFSTDISTLNSATSLGQGKFRIAVDATSPAAREKIFLYFNVGPGVAVTVSETP